MKMITPMEETMQALEISKDIELPMDPAYYDQLHSRIMASIERTEARPAPQPQYARAAQPRLSLRSHLKSWLSLVE